jgi:hypothetical protein
MAILELNLTLDDLKHEVDSIVQDTSGMHHTKAYYWDNEDLDPSNSDISGDSKVHYYLRQAKKQNSLEKVHSQFDPLAFTVRAYYKVSTGLMSSHNHYIEFSYFDISRIRLAAKGKELEFGVGTTTFERWNHYCSSGHERVMNFMNSVNEKVDENVA